MDDEENYEELYVIDQGNGARRVPTMYFPPRISRSQIDLPLISLQDARNLGGVYSYLTFSVDETTGEIENNLAMYVTNNASSTSEMPRSAGGHFAPIIYVEAEFLDNPVSVLVGGAFGNVFEWNEESNIAIHSGNIQFILEERGLDNYIIDVTAYDHDTDMRDYFNFRLDSDSNVITPINLDYDGDPTTIGQGGPIDPGQLAEDFGLTEVNINVQSAAAGPFAFWFTTWMIGTVLCCLLLWSF